MATKIKIKVTGQYNEAIFMVEPSKYYASESNWGWLTDSQRKRLERIFGNPAAYYCKYEIVSKRYKLLYQLNKKFYDICLAVGEEYLLEDVRISFDRIILKPTPNRTGIAQITTHYLCYNDASNHIGIRERVTIAKQ